MGLHCHSHQPEKVGKKLRLIILLNIVITTLQGIVGFWVGSLALISDALHNLSDVISLVISYIANRLASRKHTSKQTFGYQRAEILAALINGATLLVLSVFLIQEAINRFSSPAKIDPGPVILLACLGVAVNGVSAFLLKDEAKQSLNMKSAYMHLFSDILTSIAVALGGVFIYFTDYYLVDSYLSIFISIYLLYMAWQLILQTIRVIMQFAPDDIELDKVVEEILQDDKIANVHHIHLWQLTDQRIHFEAHIDFKNDESLSATCKTFLRIRKILKEKYNINHITLQPEFGLNGPKELIANAKNDEN